MQNQCNFEITFSTQLKMVYTEQLVILGCEVGAAASDSLYGLHALITWYEAYRLSVGVPKIIFLLLSLL